MIQQLNCALDDEERQRAYVHDGWNVTGDAYKLQRYRLREESA